MKNWILDFCGFCGVLLPADLGLEPTQQCENCNNEVHDRSARIQGQFTEFEGKKLSALVYGEPL